MIVLIQELSGWGESAGGAVLPGVRAPEVCSNRTRSEEEWSQAARFPTMPLPDIIDTIEAIT